MRIAIRMIGIATSIFWIFLIIFSVSAMYSMKDIQMDFGEPQTSVTADGEMVLSLPITVINRGLYDLGYFNVSTLVMDQQGSVIARASTFLPVIRKGEAVSTSHDVRLNLTDLLGNYQNFLFNDAELRVSEAVSLRAAQLIPVQASAEHSMPWGAPLYDFALGTPEFSAYNATHSRVTVPLIFENHASFDLAGTVQLRMYNSSNVLTGEEQTAVQAWQHSPYQGDLELYVPFEGVTAGGRFEVSFVTPFFNYGPVVIPYG